MNTHVANKETALSENAISTFEDKLTGPNGPAFYRECLDNLAKEEQRVKTALSKGVSAAEAEKLKILESALSQGRILLGEIWKSMNEGGR